MCLCALGFEFDSFLWLPWDFEVSNVAYAVNFLMLEIMLFNAVLRINEVISHFIKNLQILK